MYLQQLSEKRDRGEISLENYYSLCQDYYNNIFHFERVEALKDYYKRVEEYERMYKYRIHHKEQLL